MFTISYFILYFNILKYKYNMICNFLLWVEVFIFIIACLVIIKNIYCITKVLYMHSGKFDIDMTSKIMLTLSISYVLTTIIIGF